MNVSKIKPQNVEVLKTLLMLDEELIVYDPLYKIEDCSLCITRDISTLVKRSPLQKICVNLSDMPLEVMSFDFILEIDTPTQKYKSFYCEQFLTINNPDGSIRWFLPEHARHPDFLELYNGSGFKASLFKLISKAVFAIGLKKLVCSGGFCLYSREENYFKNQINEKGYAVFTGTVGENRKGVVAICENGRATHFLKIPISKKAEQLIQSEHTHLVSINDFDFEKLIVPESEMKGRGLRVTNIRPEYYQNTPEITDIHLKALKDLYANTFQIKMLSRLETYREIEKRLNSIKHIQKSKNIRIQKQKIERLVFNMNVLLKTFESQQLVPVAFAHGDFTPWNMFVSEKHIHLYDWELAMPEQLFLYDAFHFIFQSSVLILHQPFLEIKKKILQLEKREITIDIIERYDLDYWGCYFWYLVSNCSYYLNLYLKEERLHDQGYWLMDCWIEATNDAIKAFQRKVVLVS